MRRVWIRRGVSTVLWAMVAACLVVVALVVAFAVYLEYLDSQGEELIPGPPTHPSSQVWWHAHRTPQWSPDGRVIITQIDDAIYAVTAAGDDLWQIPQRKWRLAFWKDDPARYSPTLSSAGQISYLEDSGHDWLDVKIVSIDGRNTDTVGRSFGNRPSVAWSPDGDRLAFVETASHGPRGALIAIRGLGGTPDAQWALPSSGLRFMFNHQAIEWSARDDLAILWGTRSALTVCHVGDGEYAFLEGGNEYMPSDRVFSPAWSPDGQYLYYARLRPRESGRPLAGMALDVVRAHAATLDKHIMLTFDPVAERGIGADEIPRGLRIAPTGDRLLLVTSRDLTFDRWQDEVYVANIDGSGLRGLLWPPGDTEEVNPSLLLGNQSLHAAWSPDGSSIAVHNDDPDARVVLYTLRPDGSNVQALLCRTPDDEPSLACNP